MKVPYRFFVVMFLISGPSNSQDYRTILSKSVAANKEMSVVFNLTNTSVSIEESNDGKVHFLYRLEFEGYSKKQIEKKVNSIDVSVVNSDNHISLKANSNTTVNPINFSVNNTDNLFLKPIKTNSAKSDSIVRISKDSLINTIRRNRNPNVKDIMEQFTYFKGNSRNNMYNQVSSKSVDILRSNFIIKIPPFLKLNINAENSNIQITSNIQNELSVKQKKGFFRAKELRNSYNNFTLSNILAFEAENIIGGDYSFNTAYTSKIGSISNAKINSEFSKIQIGEIGKNTTITDYNSEYWFYNWADDFERFNLYSEYSKIHFFYPKRNHSFKVIGNNTKNLLGNGEFEINMQPTSKGEKYTMMTKDSKPGETLSGRIFFDIVHGIIYSHNDSIKTINKD